MLPPAHPPRRFQRSAVIHGVAFGFFGLVLTLAMALTRAKFVPYYIDVYQQAGEEMPDFTLLVWFYLLSQPVLSIVLPLLFVACGVIIALMRKRSHRWFLTIGAYGVLIVLFLLMIFSMYLALFNLPNLVS